jgi:flagellar motor switch protein FliN/FliY
MADETPRPDEQSEIAPPEHSAPATAPGDAATADVAARPPLANDPALDAVLDSAVAGTPAPTAMASDPTAPPRGPPADGLDLDLEPAVIGARTVPVSAADATPFAPPQLGTPQAPPKTQIELLDDVQLDVKVELGRTNLYIEDVLKLGVGSVVELNKLAGDPVDVYVNERLIARGEVLVLNDNFCVRINDIQCPVPELEGSN